MFGFGKKTMMQKVARDFDSHPLYAAGAASMVVLATSEILVAAVNLVAIPIKDFIVDNYKAAKGKLSKKKDSKL